MPRMLPLLLVAMFALVACGGQDPTLEPPAEEEQSGGAEVAAQPAGAQATIRSPADGDVVQSPVRIDMSATGVDIVPAGDPVAGEGHFHVAVDVGCVAEGEFVPGPGEEAEANGYHHFGDGSTDGEVVLGPGTYELCLQLADGLHRAFGGTDVITITVE